MTSEETKADDANAVVRWFGEGFVQLHPLLQALHRRSSVLSGPVSLQFGTGLAGVLARRLVRRLGIPASAGPHHLRVEIGHDATTLQWNRCFDRSSSVRSIFRPHGHWPDGYWIEDTGPLELKLAVDVVQGGWHWRAVSARLHGIRVPLWLMPRTRACKRIEDGGYRFAVTISLPILGEALSYGGLLEAQPQA